MVGQSSSGVEEETCFEKEIELFLVTAKEDKGLERGFVSSVGLCLVLVLMVVDIYGTCSRRMTRVVRARMVIARRRNPASF